MEELAGLLISFSFVVGVFLGRWLVSRGKRPAKDSAGLPGTNLNIPCPPCKPPRPEAPSMAELAREQSNKVKNEWINDRLPSLMDKAMQSVYEASKAGMSSIVFYTDDGPGGIILSTKSKEAALAVELKGMLRQQGFDVTFDWAAQKTDSHGYGMTISW